MRLIDAEMLNHVLIDFDDRPSFMCVLDEDIYDAPTVDAEPIKRGQWNRGVCSECNFDWRNIAPTASVMDYCPNCGANMKGK